jgi:hypothetical protein
MSNSNKPLCIIDRFEEQWAVVEFEGEKNFNIPRSLLPDNAREGDVLAFNVKIDEAETERRRKEIEKLTKDIFAEE